MSAQMSAASDAGNNRGMSRTGATSMKRVWTTKFFDWIEPFARFQLPMPLIGAIEFLMHHHRYSVVAVEKDHVWLRRVPGGAEFVMNRNGVTMPKDRWDSENEGTVSL